VLQRFPAVNDLINILRLILNVIFQVGGSDAPSTELRMSDVGLVGTNPNSVSDEDEEDLEQRAELAALQVNNFD